MDDVSIYLIVAIAASLTATVSKVVVCCARGPQPKIDEERTTLQMTQLVEAPPEKTPPPVAVADVVDLSVEQPATTVAPQAEKRDERIEEIPVPQTDEVEQIEDATQSVELKAELALVKGAKATTWAIEKDKMIMGRAPDVECSIASLTVSRRHACIERKGNEYYLSDYGSKNGTFCNGARIKEAVRLKNNDTVEVGEIYLKFRLS